MQTILRRRAFLGAALSATLLFTAACSTEEVAATEHTLVFTAIPNENTTEL